MNKHDRMAKAEIAAYQRRMAQINRENARLIAHREKTLAKFEREWERKTLRGRMSDASVSTEERAFWTEFYNLTVGEYAREFGSKYTPETFDETDRMNVGEQDWTAVIKAIRHIQSYLEQHDADHEKYWVL